MHFVQQPRAEGARRVGTGEILFIETARLHHRHRQRVAHHQRVDGAGGWRQMHRAGLALHGDIQHRFCRQRQRRGGFAGHRQQRNAFFFQPRHDEIQLFRATGVGDKQHHVAAIEHAEIAVQGFRRMDEKGRGAGAGEGCRQLFTDVAGFTDTGDNQFALAVDNGFRRADEVVAQALRQAARLLQLKHQGLASGL